MVYAEHWHTRAFDDAREDGLVTTQRHGPFGLPADTGAYVSTDERSGKRLYHWRCNELHEGEN